MVTFVLYWTKSKRLRKNLNLGLFNKMKTYYTGSMLYLVAPFTS